MATLVLQLVALLLIFAASLHDIVARTVPNGFPLALMLVGLISAIVGGHLAGSFVAGGATFVTTALCWRQGWIGGGDVKLLGATALLLPPSSVPIFIAASTIAGGGLSLLYIALGLVVTRPSGPRPSGLVARALRAERWRVSRRGPLPYICAVFAGFSFVLLGALP
jgi:prepilin peptidase CpaA